VLLNRLWSLFRVDQKNPKIRRTTIIGEKKEGGFDIIKRSLEAAWVKMRS